MLGSILKGNRIRVVGFPNYFKPGKQNRYVIPSRTQGITFNGLEKARRRYWTLTTKITGYSGLV